MNNSSISTDSLNTISQYIRSPKFFFILTFALTLVIYIFSIGFDYNIDDGVYLEQVLQENYSGIGDIFKVFTTRFNYSDYRPITGLLLAFEQYIFGRSATIFHLFNLCYYLLLGFVLYNVLRAFKIFPNKYWLAVCVLIFMIHPSHANVVSSIKNRDILIATTLALIGAYFFNRFIQSSKPLTFKVILYKILFFLVSFVFAYLTFITKNDGLVIFTIPLIIGIYQRKINIKEIVGYSIALAIILFGIRFAFIYNNIILSPDVQNYQTSYFENPLSKNLAPLSFFEIRCKAFYYYLKFQIIPTNYHFYFGYNTIPINQPKSISFILGFLGLLSSLVAILYLFIKKKSQIFGIGLSIFVLLTLPYLILVYKIAGIIAVRFGFYASIGSCILFTAILIEAYKRHKVGSYVLGLVLTITFTSFALYRSLDWKNLNTLYSRDIPHLESSYVANRMVGTFYYHEANSSQQIGERNLLLNKANEYFFNAYELYDTDPVLLRLIGNTFLRQQMPDSAYVYLLKAANSDPTNIESWKQMADYAFQIQDYQLAEFYTRQMFKIDRTNTNVIINMNRALAGQNKDEEILLFYKEIIELKPNLYLPYVYVAQVFERQNDRPLAMINYFEAFRRGFVDDRLKRGLVNYAKNHNYDQIIANYPEFFN